MKPTVAEIRRLTPSDVYFIVSEYKIQQNNHLWRSGTVALSRVYGEEMDNPELLALEDAADLLSQEASLKVAIRWAWLANVGKDSVTITQFEALTRPWVSHRA